MFPFIFGSVLDKACSPPPLSKVCIESVHNITSPLIHSSLIHQKAKVLFSLNFGFGPRAKTKVVPAGLESWSVTSHWAGGKVMVWLGFMVTWVRVKVHTVKLFTWSHHTSSNLRLG